MGAIAAPPFASVDIIHFSPLRFLSPCFWCIISMREKDIAVVTKEYIVKGAYI